MFDARAACYALERHAQRLPPLITGAVFLTIVYWGESTSALRWLAGLGWLLAVLLLPISSLKRHYRDGQNPHRGHHPPAAAPDLRPPLPSENDGRPDCWPE